MKRHIGRRGHGQAPRHFALIIAQPLKGALNLGDLRTQLLIVNAALRGQRETARRPMDELHAKRILQPTQATGHRGRRNVQTQPSRRQAIGLNDMNKQGDIIEHNFKSGI